MPNSRAEPAPVAALLLAAGRSRRFGRHHKLLQRLRGRPLVGYALAAVAGCRARPLIVVTGWQAARVSAVLAPPRCRLVRVHNRAPALGLARSLRLGLARVPARCAGVLVCLADMPQLRSADLDRLIAAFEPGDPAVVPVCDGQRGNPVLLSRALFPALRRLRGDRGAAGLLRRLPGVREVPAGVRVLADVDRARDVRSALRAGVDCRR